MTWPSGGHQAFDSNESRFESRKGEFDWDKTTVGRLLSMYFYGYIFLQFPGGYLSSRFGAKRVWGICQAVCAVCTLLTPVCARSSINMVYAVRFILGFASVSPSTPFYSNNKCWRALEMA
ncbi:vesicular glutamate transporter 2 [Elysia marginata]|uniref:Vesicular glutamate transporter 2 n=1 Tax=Elysia marginata TaxID=1093978 RepID=A0AAV4JAT1_9GAST|nr:vesicular glutamate transporter 2 [Elysia marginata]